MTVASYECGEIFMRKRMTAAALCTALAACTGSTRPAQPVVSTAPDKGEMAAAGEVAVVGNPVRRQLDAADQQAMARTRQSALETAQPNQPLPWQNQRSGNSGIIVPGEYYQTAQGQYCRAFEQTITIGGETEQGSGKACRQPDGSWRVIE
jgi:surface antigen